MTVRTHHLAIAAVATVLLSAAGSLAGQEIRQRLGRTIVRSVAPLYLPGNQPSDRYQVVYVWDQFHTNTCMVVLRDLQTEQFALSAVPVESCQP